MSTTGVRTVLRWLQRLLLGAEHPPPLEEERYARDSLGRPDLARFTRPAAHYAGYLDEYLDSLADGSSPGTRGRGATREWQAHAYRKGVLGQWGLIARGPTEALPIVLELARHPLPEGRQAAAGVLEAWEAPATAPGGDGLLAAALEFAERELASDAPDTETLAVLLGMLGRRRNPRGLPVVARILRDPSSRTGDLDWAALETLECLSGERFRDATAPIEAATEWLSRHGL